MIYRLVYSGKGTVEKNGRSSAVSVKPSTILKMYGPFLDVTIAPPRSVVEQYEKEGRKHPTARVRALIDTGAASSIITPRIADDAGLIHTGYQRIASVQDEQVQPVYFGLIGFSWGMAKETPLTACPLKNFDCLIGRDVLMHWYLTYDGANGTIVICD